MRTFLAWLCLLSLAHADSALPGGPAHPGLLVPDADAPSSLVSDGAHLYWIDGRAGIVRMPAVGGPRVALVATRPEADLALADGWIYYRDDEADEIRRVSTGGGRPQTIARERDHQGPLVVDGGYVHWTRWTGRDRQQLLRAPVRGGDPEVVARELPPVFDLAVDGEVRYLASREGLFVAAPGETLRRVARGPVHDLALDGTSVYWRSDGALWWVPRAGGRPARLARGVDALALTDEAVYWMDGFRLLRRLKRGGPQVERGRFTPSHAGLQAPSALTVDASGAHWLSQGVYTPDPPDELPCPKGVDRGSGVLARMPR